jgi:hypothetical protein
MPFTGENRKRTSMERQAAYGTAYEKRWINCEHRAQENRELRVVQISLERP